MSLWSYLARKINPFLVTETISFDSSVNKLIHESHVDVGVRPGEAITALDLRFSKAALPFVALDFTGLKFGRMKVKVECLYSDGSRAVFAEREVDGKDAFLSEERMPFCNGLVLTLKLDSGLPVIIRVHAHVLEVSDAAFVGVA